MTAPSQQTFSGSPRAADDHGIHVTSHAGQVIRLPTPGTPRLPQFQHSLGSGLCWLPLILFPPQLFPHDRDPRPGGNACTWRRLGRRRLIHPRDLPMDLRAVSPASWIIPVVPPVPGSRLPPGRCPGAAGYGQGRSTGQAAPSSGAGYLLLASCRPLSPQSAGPSTQVADHEATASGRAVGMSTGSRRVSAITRSTRGDARITRSHPPSS